MQVCCPSIWWAPSGPLPAAPWTLSARWASSLRSTRSGELCIAVIVCMLRKPITAGTVYNDQSVYAVNNGSVAGGTAWAALRMPPAVPLTFSCTRLKPLWLAECAYAWHDVSVSAAPTLIAKDNERQSAALLLLDICTHVGCMLMGHMPALPQFCRSSATTSAELSWPIASIPTRTSGC